MSFAGTEGAFVSTGSPQLSLLPSLTELEARNSVRCSRARPRGAAATGISCLPPPPRPAALPGELRATLQDGACCMEAPSHVQRSLIPPNSLHRGFYTSLRTVDKIIIT